MANQNTFQETSAHYLASGKAHMTDVNLLTLLLGGKEDITRRLLMDSNFTELAKKSLSELKSFGLTQRMAIILQSAIEMGRRRHFQSEIEKPIITNSRDSYLMFAAKLMDLDHEQFHLLVLNKSNRVIKYIVMSIGGTDATIVDVKLLFKRVLEAGGASVVVAHNHPSGRLRPSQADLDLTRKIKEGLKTLDLSILDHIIVAGDGYYSFADEGVL